MPNSVDSKIAELQALGTPTLRALPASLTINKGAAAAVLESLVRHGLIAEQPAGRDDETWRDVDGQRTMLVITEAGLEAIGVVPDPAPPLSRNLLARAVVHRIQEKAFGRLRPAAARRLRRLAGGIDGGGANGPSAGPALKPGSRLLREWRGETQVVEVTHEGLVWKGNRYRSLSAVARAITGVRWSGPRFFGLTHQR